jgi:hypothetical protein
MVALQKACGTALAESEALSRFQVFARTAGLPYLTMFREKVVTRSALFAWA